MDPPTHTLETDEATDGDVVAALQHVCALGAATSSEGSSMASPKLVGRSGVNAIFRTGTGLRYPVWKVILNFARCFRHLEVATTCKSERTLVILQVNSLVGTNSEWLGLCPDLVHLLQFPSETLRRQIPCVTSSKSSRSEWTISAQGDCNHGEHGAGCA